MTTKQADPFATTYHRDGSITVWSVYQQQWIRTFTPSDETLASLSPRERARVEHHIARHADQN